MGSADPPLVYGFRLALNDVEFNAAEEDKYVSMLALAEGSLTEPDFAAWLRRHIVLASDNKVQEKRKRYAR